MNILELYSGVGGMHMALKESGVSGKVVAAADINTVANSVYSHNFPDTLLLNRNIQSFTAPFINKQKIDAIFMSPPCQPFTRNGLKKDELDPRACSFTHLLHILPELNVKYLLIENVKGFENSLLHEKLIHTLRSYQFTFQEFILSPTQIGVSNTRHRYYLLAKKRPLKFSFKVGDYLMENFPGTMKDSELFKLSDIIETDADTTDFLLPDNLLLKRAMILDICNPESERSCCFTKAYGKYVEGTGSVFTPKTKQETDDTYKNLKEFSPENIEYLNCIKDLQLRFFTPTEVARLMSFPAYFTFPNSLTKNQKYRLLGNSINVKLVSKLIEMLVQN